MISSQLEGFSNWYPIAEATKQAPPRPGTYVIRMSGGRCFGQFHGETDIVYIGSAKQLKRRLYQYMHPGRTQWTNQRVHKLSKKYDFEVAWQENDNPKIPEHNLLREFLAQHDELPPLNRADIRKMEMELPEGIVLSDKLSMSKV